MRKTAIATIVNDSTVNVRTPGENIEFETLSEFNEWKGNQPRPLLIVRINEDPE